MDQTIIANATVADTLVSLDAARTALLSWDCGDMEIEVATSLTDPTPTTINFTSTIGHKKHVPKPEKRTDDTCYWFPPNWRYNTKEFRQKTAIPYFTNIARLAGFKVQGSWENKFNNIIFRCTRGRSNNEHSNKAQSARYRPKKKLKRPDLPPKPRNRPSQRCPKLTDDQLDDPLLEEEREDADLVKCSVRWTIF